MSCAVTEETLVFDLTGNGSKSYGVSSVVRAGQLPTVTLSTCDLDDVYTFNQQGGVRFGDANYDYNCSENGDTRLDLDGSWTLNFGTKELLISNDGSNPDYLLGSYLIVEHDQDQIVLQGDWQGIASQITLTRNGFYQF
ncbi:MAG: hypothetical protein AAFQ98_02130 [Bacteroidota bacterium]